MQHMTLRIPNGLAKQLYEHVEESEQFKDKSEAVRYYIRQGLQQSHFRQSEVEE